MTSRLMRLSIALMLCSACSYNGAVYTQYTELSLVSAAIRPEEATPVDVTLGWDRGSVSFVPKLESEKGGNEAASVLSKEKTSLQILAGTDDDVLAVDAAFLSGNAALIASLPYIKTTGDQKWRVIAEDGSTLYSGTIEGKPEERIMAALVGGAFNCAEEEELSNQYALVGMRTDADRVYARAADDLFKEFRAAFDAAVKQGATKKAAFQSASLTVTEDEEPCGPHRLAILEALRRSYGKVN